jgi:hypothetical protein
MDGQKTKKTSNNKRREPSKLDDPLIVFDQNISGLQKKADELISSMFPILPHILCFSEHHLKHFELDRVNIKDYKLLPHIVDN